MIISADLFTIGIWVAYAGVSVASLYLLIFLVREWKRKELW